MWFKNYKKENEVLEAKLEIANKKIKSIEEYNIKKGAEWVKEKSELNSQIESCMKEYNQLFSKFEMVETKRKSLVATLGGYTTGNNKLKKEREALKEEIKTIVKAKEKVDKDYKKYFDLYNLQIERVDNLTSDIYKLNQRIESKNAEIKELKKKLELKENPVTIQELKEYQMFGKPRGRARKNV